MVNVILIFALWQIGPAVVTTRGEGTTRQTVQSLNGREVPVESTEERVVTDRPGLRIIERTVHKYDPNGRPGPAEKIRIETRTGPDGSTEATTSTWRGDINGNVQLAERSVAVTRQSGPGNSSTSVTVERPSSDGRMEVFEKREETRRSAGEGQSSESQTTQRRDLNGRWLDVLRTTVEQTKRGASQQENKAEYEAATSGEMRLIRQTVSRTTGAVTERDIFEPATAGRVSSAGEPLKLVRQQIIEKTAVAGGVVESTSVRFADPSSPGRLGPPRKVEETTCKGECAPAIMK